MIHQNVDGDYLNIKMNVHEKGKMSVQNDTQFLPSHTSVKTRRKKIIE